MNKAKMYRDFFKDNTSCPYPGMDVYQADIKGDYGNKAHDKNGKEIPILTADEVSKAVDVADGKFYLGWGFEKCKAFLYVGKDIYSNTDKDLIEYLHHFLASGYTKINIVWLERDGRAIGYVYRFRYVKDSGIKFIHCKEQYDELKKAYGE